MIISQEDLDKLTYEQVIEALSEIEKIESRLKIKQKELSQIQLSYDIGRCYIVNGYAPMASAEAEATYCPKKAMSGVYRKKPENAINSAIRRMNASIIEAYAERIELDFVPDWQDYEQEKFTIVFNFSRECFEATRIVNNVIGAPIMSLETVTKIVKHLNSGRIILTKVDYENEKEK